MFSHSLGLLIVRMVFRELGREKICRFIDLLMFELLMIFLTIVVRSHSITRLQIEATTDNWSVGFSIATSTSQHNHQRASRRNPIRSPIGENASCTDDDLAFHVALHRKTNRKGPKKTCKVHEVNLKGRWETSCTWQSRVSRRRGKN